MVAVSGLVTNSPLATRELADQCQIPIGCSAGDGDQLARLVLEHCRIDA